jgi:hypothetical protein
VTLGERCWQVRGVALAGPGRCGLPANRSCLAAGGSTPGPGPVRAAGGEIPGLMRVQLGGEAFDPGLRFAAAVREPCSNGRGRAGG